MRKLKLPRLVENPDLPKTMTQKEFDEMMEEQQYKLIPEICFDVGNLFCDTDIDWCDNGYYVYAYILSLRSYYDYAVVKTDDFFFKTYAQYKKAVKDMMTQLVKRWKDWVHRLYEEVEE